jgi:hypothetical protein
MPYSYLDFDLCESVQIRGKGPRGLRKRRPVPGSARSYQMRRTGSKSRFQRPRPGKGGANRASRADFHS